MTTYAADGAESVRTHISPDHENDPQAKLRAVDPR